MKKVIIIGRLVRNPEIRYTSNGICCASFSVAVDRRFKQDGQPTADFPRVVVWGKTAEFIEKYFSQGMKIALEGRIQTGSYKNKDDNTVYTTDIVAEAVEFVESKGASKSQNSEPPKTDDDGFMNIPDGLEDEGLPFN